MSRAKTVLVIDADAASLQRVAILLENEGYRVVTARDGAEAEQRLQETKPDLIVTEILVPVRNGYQICRAVKEDAALRGVQVLFLTVKAQASDRFWAKRVGADGFVAKPYDPAGLLREIHALLQRSPLAPT
jgi:twitching motility two-component system response regulator PilH